MAKKLNTAFSTGNAVIPARVINIAVDTVYLYSQQTGTYAGSGIYMMDNNALGGSKGEGGHNLRPHMSCNLMTPTEAHFTIQPLIKRWKNCRKRFTPISQSS